MSDLPLVAILADWLMKSTVLLGMASLAAYAARKLGASAALRHWLWALVIGAVASLPFVAALTPLRLEVLPNFVLAPAASTASPAPVGSTLADAFVSLYALVTCALLLRVGVGQWRLACVWRSSMQVESVAVEAASLASAMGVGRSVDVRIASGRCAPMTWGVLRPKIVLPAAAIGWTSGQRRLVLMHEMAHVIRADSLLQLVASCVAALYWIHPALWFAVAQLRREQEHACDDRVLLAGAAPHSYATTLLDVAAGRSARTIGAVAMADQSQLEERLSAIVSERRRGRGASAMAFVLCATVAALATVAVAAPVSKPAAATPPVSVLSHISEPEPRSTPVPLPVISPGGIARENVADVRTMREVTNRHAPSLRRAPRSQLSMLTPVPAAPAAPAQPATLPQLATVEAPTPIVAPTPVVAPTPPTPMTAAIPPDRRRNRSVPIARSP